MLRSDQRELSLAKLMWWLVVVVEFYSGRDLLTGSFTAFYRGLYPALSIIKIIICQIILN